MIQPMSSEQETVIQDARALLAQHQPAEAARRLHLHLTTRPGTATAYMLLGVALSGTGEGLRVLQAFEQAIAMEPENAAAHYNLGQRQSFRQGSSALWLASFFFLLGLG